MNSAFFSNLQSNLNGYGGGAAGDVASMGYGGVKKILGLPAWLLKLIFGQGQQQQNPGQVQSPYSYNPSYLSSGDVSYAPGYDPGQYPSFSGLAGPTAGPQ